MDDRRTGVPFPEEDIGSSLLQIVLISPGKRVISCDSFQAAISRNISLPPTEEENPSTTTIIVNGIELD